MKVVKIEWMDSCSSDLNWTKMSQLEGGFEAMRVISYGILIEQNDECITIAQSYGGTPEQASCLLTIPQGCVKSMTEIDTI